MAAPPPAPASVRALRPDGPAPTPAPAPPGQPLHVRLTPAEIAERQASVARRQEERNIAENGRRQEQEQIVGPFWARSQEDVRRAKIEWDAEQAKKRRARPAKPDQAVWIRGRSGQGVPNAINDQDLLRRSTDLDTSPESEWVKIRANEDMSAEMEQRQTEDQEKCYVGNAQLSCYPTAGLEVPQGRYSKFIWNPYYPLFIQQGYVDVYLYRQDQDRIQTSWTSQQNQAGRISFMPSDSWWEDRPRAQNIQEGQNISWPFYFVVNPSGLDMDGKTVRQSTWNAIQTAVPAAIASSRSAAAAASASASAATATAAAATYAAISSSIAAQYSAELQSTLNAQGFTGTQTLVGSLTTVLSDGQTVVITATGRANGTLSNSDGSGGAGNSSDDGGPGIPRWAIAVIVVLGLLAVAFVAGFVYFCMRKARRRTAATGGSHAPRQSTGSGSPMMRDIGGLGAAGSLDGAMSPIGTQTHSLRALSTAGGPDSSIGFGSAALAAEAGAAGAASGAAGTGYLQSSRSFRSSGDSHLFSSEEASRMADAFRNALRKPEFTAGGGFGASVDMESPREEDGDTPGADDDEHGSPITGPLGSSGQQSSPAKVAPALLKQELASEGKDLRQVGDRKKAQYHDKGGTGSLGASAESA
ncbi:unnamed protein product [Tilletia laevis]|nr:hypothetical protein CF336_g1455 [Tilletia laevis]KAE8207791.1 hypothetical protein CF335_g881 [Tilletia laevis]CAD6933238.1 unnamed protein product [Tilletia laevis]